MYGVCNWTYANAKFLKATRTQLPICVYPIASQADLNHKPIKGTSTGCPVHSADPQAQASQVTGK